MGSQERQTKRTVSPLLAFLASIGGLFLFSVLLFFALIIWIVRSGMGVPAPPQGDVIGIIDISGTITDSEPILRQLLDFKKNENIKAVVVRINSPGGSVGPSQEIYDELRKLDRKKPVVASLASVAASGGYYIALGARYIIANPGTITGSIGVIMHKANIAELLKKIGIKTTVVKSGHFKDLGNITRDLTPEERKVLEDLLDDIHSQFIDAVSHSRKIPTEKIKAIADGRIFSGHQAQQLNLIDAVGNFTDAVDKAAELASMEGEPQLYYPQKDKWLLFRKALEEEAAALITNVIHQITAQKGGSVVYGQ